MWTTKGRSVGGGHGALTGHSDFAVGFGYFSASFSSIHLHFAPNDAGNLSVLRLLRLSPLFLLLLLLLLFLLFLLVERNGKRPDGPSPQPERPASPTNSPQPPNGRPPAAHRRPTFPFYFCKRQIDGGISTKWPSSHQRPRNPIESFQTVDQPTNENQLENWQHGDHHHPARRPHCMQMSCKVTRSPRTTFTSPPPPISSNSKVASHLHTRRDSHQHCRL